MQGPTLSSPFERYRSYMDGGVHIERVDFTFSPQYPIQYCQQPSFSSARPQKGTRGATCRLHVFSLYPFFEGIRREGKQLSPPYDTII